MSTRPSRAPSSRRHPLPGACALVLLACSVSSAQLAKTFSAPVRMNAPPDALVAAGDLDGDGDVDLLQHTYIDYTPPVADYRVFRPLLNDGSGRFVPGVAVDVPLISVSGSWLIGDVTGDGLPDVLSPRRTSPTAGGYTVHPGIGNGLFGPAYGVEVPALLGDALLADHEGDGDLDIALLARPAGTSDPSVRWLRNDGAGAFVSSSTVVLPDTDQGISFLGSIAAADFDGDGVLDLVIGRADETAVSFVPTISGEPVWQSDLYLFGDEDSDVHVSAGDLDGDGDPDVVTDAFRQTGQPTYTEVLENLGGAFVSVQATALPYAERTRSTHLVDWDGDGDLDHARVFSGSSSSSSQWIHFRENVGGVLDLQGGPLVNVRAMGRAAPGPADLDGDDAVDFVAPHSILFGRNAFFPSVEPYGSVSAGLLRDWEGDGDLDLVLAAASLNNGAGSFAPAGSASKLPVPPAPLVYQNVAGRADFDGDGSEDLIMGLHQPPVFGSASVVSWRLLSDFGTGFYTDVGPALPPGPQGLAGFGVPIDEHAMDLDGDTDLDLLLPGGFRRNDGSGHFPDLVAAWPGRTPLAAGDVDGDGDVDVLVTSSAGLGLLRNDGQLGFPEEILDGLPPDFVTLLDLDDDGDPDVAADTGFFENLGGSFDERLSPGYTVHTVGAADVDEDGLTDLLVSGATNDFPGGLPPQEEALYVYRRSGPGLAYDASVQYDIPDKVYRFFDADEDGDVDAMVGGILLNLRHHANGAVVQFGTGTPGTAGVVPTLGAGGPTRAGETVSLRLRRALGGTLTLLTASLTQSALPDVPLPGMTSYNSPWAVTRLFGTGGAPGQAAQGAWTLDFTVAPSFAGISVFHQAYALDPGAGPTGISSTNGLQITYGH